MNSTDVYTLLVVIFFAAWVILTIFNQFRKFSWLDRLKRYDVFSLLPVWTFFAPNPLTYDYQLLYRYKLIDGQLTQWKAVEQKVPALSWLFNPNKRFKKGILDICSILCNTIFPIYKGTRNYTLSMPYIAVLNYISNRSHNILAEEVQFIIVTTYGADKKMENNIVFISELHKLG
jgi:hypothetical protein